MRPVLSVLCGLLPFLPSQPHTPPHASSPPRASAPWADELDALSEHLSGASEAFETALAAEPEDFALAIALRDFDDALVEVEWQLTRLQGARENEGWGLVWGTTADELRIARARLDDVQRVAAELGALVRLHLDMRRALASGRRRHALELYATRMPEPIDPLDWPSVVRRRLRGVERELADAEAGGPAYEPGPGAAPR